MSDFSSKYRNEPGFESRKILFESYIEDIFLEKQLEYRHKSNIKLSLNYSTAPHTGFIEIAGSGLHRAISNIINNSFEAMENSNSGTLKIDLSQSNNIASIAIVDSGAGIPEELILNLGERGLSGKTNRENRGLGLWHAKQVIEQINGRIEIKSKLNVGTKIKIEIPLSGEPAWAIDILNLNDQKIACLIGLKQEVGLLLQERFKISYTNLELLFFDSTKDWLEWVTRSGDQLSFRKVSCFSQSFISLPNTVKESIQTAELGPFNFYLISDKYNELSIQAKAADANLKIIPERFLRTFPIN